MVGFLAVSRRICIKGTPGAGKSTLARRLAAHLQVPWVELDALHHGPNWTAASAAELQVRVRDALEADRGWVVDGNYDRKLGSFVLERTELVVWLDLPLGLKLARVVRRTLGRIVRREVLWNGNRETFRDGFWGRDSLLPWTVRAHFKQRREWPALLATGKWVRLRSPTEVEAWVADFCAVRR